MPDGTRKRRFSKDQAKRLYYSQHRQQRFAGLLNNPGKFEQIVRRIERTK